MGKAKQNKKNAQIKRKQMIQDVFKKQKKMREVAKKFDDKIAQRQGSAKKFEKYKQLKDKGFPVEMSTIELILNKTRSKNVVGIIPINKPRGISSELITRMLTDDATFVLEKASSRYRPEFSVARSLDRFASGLITYMVGARKYRRKTFLYAPCKYTGVVELGVKREFDSIEGQVIKTLDIDGLDDQTLDDAFQRSIGLRKYTPKASRHYNFIGSYKCDKLVEDYYSKISYDDMQIQEEKNREPQKYRLPPRYRMGACYEMNLLAYNKPFVKFELKVQGCVFPKQHVIETIENIGTVGSLVELVRTQEGPMHLDDPRVLQIHETNLECYYDRMVSMTPFYDQFMKNYSLFLSKDRE